MARGAFLGCPRRRQTAAENDAGIAVKPFGWLVAVTIFVTFAAVPAWVPQEMRVGGISFQYYELLLLAAAAVALVQPTTVSVVKYIIPFIAVCVVTAGWSLVVAGANFGKMGSDVRWPFYTAVAMFVASKIVGTPNQTRCLQAVLATVWFSAIMVMLASTTGIELVGKSESASLAVYGGDIATRFLTPATFLAVVIAAVCITCLISGNRLGFRVSVWLVPATVLIMLSFSRNHLLGLAAAVLFALFAFRSARSVVASVWAGSIVVLIGIAIQLGVANVFSAIPATDYIAAQAHGYVERVINGLKPDNQAIDPSVQYRRKENATLSKKISESPVIGHGFGYAYKAPSGPAGDFFRETAPYYAHNFYLWLLLKAGWVGMVAFVWMAFVPLVRVVLKPVSTLQVATASAAVGLLAISVFAPIPNDSPGAPLLGAVLGVAVALSGVRTAPKVQQQTVARAEVVVP